MIEGWGVEGVCCRRSWCGGVEWVCDRGELVWRCGVGVFCEELVWRCGVGVFWWELVWRCGVGVFWGRWCGVGVFWGR